MSGAALQLNLAGCTATFSTDDAALMAYARGHLAALGATEPRALPPAVSVTLRWHEGQPPRERPAEGARLERVDRDLYSDGVQLWWFRVDDCRDLFLHCRWEDGRLTVEGDFYFRLGGRAVSDRLRRVASWRQQPRLRARRYTTLLSYAVYYPCWWWLEQMQGLHPLHAAAVLVDDGVVLLAGPSGVGKSTLSVALALQPGARLLADSFVLTRGRDVWGVHEPVLLDSWSRRWLGLQPDELHAHAGTFCLGRDGYHLPPDHLGDHGEATLLVLPRRAPEAFVRRLSAEEAQQRVSAANLIVNDLRRYWAFAAVLEQLRSAGLVARREAALERLTRAIPCYEIGITGAMSATATVDAIRELLRDPRLQIAAAQA